MSESTNTGTPMPYDSDIDSDPVYQRLKTKVRRRTFICKNIREITDRQD